MKKFNINHPYEVLNFLSICDELGSEEKRILKELNTYLDSLRPEIYKYFNQNTYPKSFISTLGSHQIMGCNLDFEGNKKRSDLFYALLLFSIETLDSGLRSLVSVHSSLAMYALSRYAPPEHKSEILNEMQSFKKVGCFALTEPLHGSDPASMITSVTHKNGQSYLNGEKHWVTNAKNSDYMVVWFKDKDQYRGAFINPKSKGVEITAMPEMMSLRLSPSYLVKFNDVEIPKTQFLEVEGLKGPLTCLNNARWGVAWGALGAASSCFEEALNYTQNRMQFGKPLSHNQLVQEKLVYMWTQIQLSLSFLNHITKLKTEKKMLPQHVSISKMHHVSESLKIARMSRDLLGGIGTTQKFHTFRHMVNLESVNTYEGTENIHKLILGNYLTNQPAF